MADRRWPPPSTTTPSCRGSCPTSTAARQTSPAMLRVFARAVPAPRRELRQRDGDRRGTVAAAGATFTPEDDARFETALVTAAGEDIERVGQLAEVDGGGAPHRSAPLPDAARRHAGRIRAPASDRRCCGPCSTSPTRRTSRPTSRPRRHGTGRCTSATASRSRASCAAPTARHCGRCGATLARDRSLRPGRMSGCGTRRRSRRSRGRSSGRDQGVTGISPPSAYGSISSIWSPLQNVPGS